MNATTSFHADCFRRSWGALGAVCLCATTAVLAGCGEMASQWRNAEGVRFYDEARYDEALREFQEASYDDPRGADAYYNLAETYHRLGRVQHCQADIALAERNYHMCLDRDSDHAECYRGLAVLLAEQGQTDQAFQLIQCWSQTHPKAADARVELARLNEEVGKRQAAEQLLYEALNIEPDNPRALAALGKMREDAGDKAQALANYQRSLAADSRQPQVASRVSALGGYRTSGAPAGATQPGTRVADRNQPPPQ